MYGKETLVWDEKIDTEVLFEILYIAKILSLYKLVVYVDWLAGKKKLDGGKQGSLLITFDIIQQGLKVSTINRHP